MPRGDTKVFVGNLPPDCRVRDIEKFFEPCGRVHNVLIKQKKFGFAEFETGRQAEDAVYDLHGKKLLGNRLTVEFSKGVRGGERERRAPWVSKYGAPVRTKYALKVYNLSRAVSWQDLKDELRKGGEITFAEAHTDTAREGRVEFATMEDLERVMKRYQGLSLNGRKIELARVEIPKSLSKSKSRDRSTSRNRSRDRRSKSRIEENSSPARKLGRSRSRRSGSKSDRSQSRGSRRSGSASPGLTVDPEDQDVRRRKRSISRTASPAPKLRRKEEVRSRSNSRNRSSGRDEDDNLKSSDAKT